MTRERVQEIIDDGFLLGGMALVGIGLAQVSLAVALTAVGALMLGLVSVPRLILLWRGPHDRQ